ncbi:type VII secretion integral membrane protein EccD [Corynebacterium sp. MSK008]|uniref:type VII secretion integral membrane protein EccD n=1 Tax=Corynebacterium sp. MSK008 TaxID=3050188 RepID=UPI00255015D2|nr:type VII secretion integral membrane protein EccD [Corynebacterium sp. MSK008]MDK8880108.1 type VII secretion integral membrane protein EccD [Corynebacterium sp. MSK008]
MRVTVRISVVAFHRDIDVTLPTSSTLSEVLPELARLVELPEVHRPWQATTAGGAVLDMHTPLYALKLHDGATVALHPQEPTPPPVVRDAADALAGAAESTRQVRGLDVVATFTGFAAVLLLARVNASWPVALAAVALLALAVASIGRSRAAFAAVPLLAGLAAGAWVAGGSGDATSLGLGVLAGLLAAAVAVGVGVALGLAGAAQVAFTAAVCVLAGAGAAGVWLPGPLAPPALTVLTGVLGVMATPGAATRAAGLTVPRVPTAGEEFDRSDDYQHDVDARSAAAAAIASAIAAAIAVCCVPALLWLGRAGGAWTFAFCLGVAAALVVYASRQHWAVPRACLTAVALSAVVAAAAAAAQTGHPACIVLAALAALTAAATVAWAPRVPDVEPTTIVWFERAEIAATIAVIPLAVHLTGLFDMIRGL